MRGKRRPFARKPRRESRIGTKRQAFEPVAGPADFMRQPAGKTCECCVRAGYPRPAAIDKPLDRALGAGHALVQHLPALCDTARQHVRTQFAGGGVEGAALVQCVEFQSPAKA